MDERKYLTIDPLLLETLDINQNRINYIFDLLHGRDPKLHSLKTKPKLPNIIREHNRAKSPRQTSVPKKRISSMSMINSPKHADFVESLEEAAKESIPHKNKSLNPKQRPIVSKPSLSSRRSTELRELKSQEQENPKSSLTSRKDQTESSVLAYQNHIIEERFEKRRIDQEKKKQAIRDYGQINSKRAKSLELNPKDIYRIEIEHLVSQALEIELLEDSEKLMKRLKKRYKHLRKFDRNYYSQLSKNDLLAV